MTIFDLNWNAPKSQAAYYEMQCLDSSAEERAPASKAYSCTESATNSDSARVSSWESACICNKNLYWSFSFSRSLTIIICRPNGLLKRIDLILSTFGGLGSSELLYSSCMCCNLVIKEAEDWSSSILSLLMKFGIRWRLY